MFMAGLPESTNNHNTQQKVASSQGKRQWTVMGVERGKHREFQGRELGTASWGFELNPK